MREYPVNIEVELTWEDGEKTQETYIVRVEVDSRIKARLKARDEFKDYIEEQKRFPDLELSDYRESFTDYRILKIYILDDPYIKMATDSEPIYHSLGKLPNVMGIPNN